MDVVLGYDRPSQYLVSHKAQKGGGTYLGCGSTLLRAKAVHTTSKGSGAVNRGGCSACRGAAGSSRCSRTLPHANAGHNQCRKPKMH